MNRSKKVKGSVFSRWPFWVGIISLLLVVGASAAGLKNLFSGKKTASKDPYTEVKQGPLTISITESGTVRASEMDIIKNEVEGQTSILYLIPEGAMVKKGELLVELDSSSIQDELVDQEIRVKNAESALISATENFEVVKNQAQSDVDRARLDYQFALQDLEKYKDGEYPKALNETQAKIKLAEEELTRAQEKAKWSSVLYGEKYLSQTEKEADELAAKKKELDLELAKNDLKLLQDFTYKRQIAQLESDVEQTKMAMERIERKSKASIKEAEANLDAKGLEYKRQQGKYEKLQEQISKAKMFAPADGLAVYATSNQGGFHGGDDEPLQEGQAVRERQELIHLPRTATYIAQIKIHESSMEKVKLGLPARITIDALPGKTYTGRVSKIAPLPDSTSVFMNPDLKVYNTEIMLDQAAELRTGMSCRVEIIVAQFPAALHLPVQTVARLGKDTVVYVDEGGEWRPRKVEIGLDNNRMIQIASGVKAGERVLLVPPISATGAEEPDEEQQAENARLLAATPAPKSGPAATTETLTARAGEVDFQNMTEEQRAEFRNQAMEKLKAAGIPMGADGRPDFANMTEEQRTKAREMFGGMGRRSGGATNAEGGGGAPGMPPGMGGPGGGSGGGGDRSERRRNRDSGQSSSSNDGAESSDSGEASE